MSRRNRRRRHSPDRGKYYLAGGLGALALLLIAGFGYLKFTTEEAPSLAKDTLCPIDGPRSVTVVLLDTSDTLAEVTRRQISTVLTDAATETLEYGLFEIRRLDPEIVGGEIVFSRCNPGDGSNLSELVANPSMARRRWAEGFEQPLREALTTNLVGGDARSSPIMESIQAISVDRFAGQARSSIDKRLIVVSDLIEHTDAYSQYRGDLSFATYKATPASRRTESDLQQAGVFLQVISRPDTSVDEARLLEFWIEWIEDNSGRFERATRLPGAN